MRPRRFSPRRYELFAVLLVAVFGFLAQGLLVGPSASLPPPSGTANEALLPAAVEPTVAPDVESSAPAATRAPSETDAALERYRAIVGGLLFSTFVSLILLPTIYSWLDVIRHWPAAFGRFLMRWVKAVISFGGRLLPRPKAARQ